MSLAERYPPSMTIKDLEIENELNRGLVWAFLEQGKKQDREFAETGLGASGTMYRSCAVSVAKAEELITSAEDAKSFANVGSWLNRFVADYFEKPEKPVVEAASNINCSADTSTGSDDHSIIVEGMCVNPMNGGLYDFLKKVAEAKREQNKHASGPDWQSISYLKAARQVAGAEIHVADYNQAIALKYIGKTIAKNIEDNFFSKRSDSHSFRKHRLPTVDFESPKPQPKKIQK